MLLPVGTTRRTNHIVVSMTLTHTTVLTSSSSLTTQLTVLHDSLTDPVDSWISSDRFMHRINHDHFIIQISGILTDPIGVEHSQSTSQSSCSLLSFRSSTTLEFYLVDTLTFWFTISCSLGDRLLAPTTSKAHTVDDVTLFCSVAESSCFVRTSGSRSAMDGSEMTQLPASDTEEETKEITLFLLVEFLEVFVCTHRVLMHLISVTICS